MISPSFLAPVNKVDPSRENSTCKDKGLTDDSLQLYLSNTPCLPCKKTEQLTINTIESSCLVVATSSQNRHGGVDGDTGDDTSLTL